jgi:hypothetical protein
MSVFELRCNCFNTALLGLLSTVVLQLGFECADFFLIPAAE